MARTARWYVRGLMASALSFSAACGGDPPTNTAGVARVEVSPASASLKLDADRGLTALTYNAKGAIISVPVTWASSAPTLISVASTGKPQITQISQIPGKESVKSV